MIENTLAQMWLADDHSAGPLIMLLRETKTMIPNGDTIQLIAGMVAATQVVIASWLDTRGIPYTDELVWNVWESAQEAVS